MSQQGRAVASSSQQRAGLSRTWAFGGVRAHVPSLIVLAVGVAISSALFVLLAARGRGRARAAFDAEATSIVGNLRSAFERPLEVLEATAALFEASREVSRAEFGRFVRPALERHPGIRAMEWIPIVPRGERAHYEAAARADGLVDFQFRQRTGAGVMVPATEREEYLPIYFMEPGHPFVLGFDCASDEERRTSAERARLRAAPVASERIQMLDDPPSSYSIAVFQPVFDPARPRSAGSVRGFACEVFRVRAVAEQAIAESSRRGLQVTLLDPTTVSPNKRVLFDSSPAGAADGVPAQEAPGSTAAGFRLETPLQYADRPWRIVLTTQPGYGAQFRRPAWFALGSGLGASLLIAVVLSAARVIRGLRHQVRAAQKLGRYTLLEKVGEGGSGVVYRARHAMLRRPTAIKLISDRTRDPRRLARFEREVQLTSELTHPNTIAIYDYGHTPEGTFYYAMEFIEGVTLEQLVERDGPLPASRVSHLLQQACRALAEAHGVGLIHRDIKPANLMICRRAGIPDFLKVMDFGLVKDVGAAEGRQDAVAITESAGVTVLGTPLYLSPEAISRPNEIDHRADIYALGAVGYFLLVGEPVFGGNSVVEVFGHHLFTTPQRPSERMGRPVAASFEDILLRCLRKDPSDRFPSAAALLASLTAATSEIGAWTESDAHAWWDTRGDALLAAVHEQMHQTSRS